MNNFRASAGMIDLEPQVGCWLTGFAARPYPSDGQHDPILARAVLLDDGAMRIAIIACDLIGIDAGTIASLRSRIAEKSNGRIPAGNILFSCTHSHSAPATLRFRGVLGFVNERWWSAAQEKIVALVASLDAKLAPAQFAFASSTVDDIGFNRQDQTHPIDKILSCIAIDAIDNKPIATLINYAVHPVTLSYGNLKLSGDVPGHATMRLQEMRGGDASLYLQGACGDVNPASDLRKGWGNGTFDDVANAGDPLAQVAHAALQNAPRTSDVRLNTAQCAVELPLDMPPGMNEVDALFAQFEADLRRAREDKNLVNEGISVAGLRWAGELKGALLNNTLPITHRIEAWCAAINDVRIAAVPLEPYSDIGLDFKRGIQPLQGMFLGYSNGLLGYCATDWAKAQGGYGPNDACRWFPEQLTAIGAGAAQRVSDACVELARSL
jgi:neutral ceramidase